MAEVQVDPPRLEVIFEDSETEIVCEEGDTVSNFEKVEVEVDSESARRELEGKTTDEEVGDVRGGDDEPDATT